MNQDQNIHDPGLTVNNRHSGHGLNNRHPGLDPGSILILFTPLKKWVPGQARNDRVRWIPDRASLVRNDEGLL
jgi:hypothetical protein